MTPFTVAEGVPDVAIDELDNRPSLLCSDDAIPHVADTVVADTTVTDISVAENYLNVLVWGCACPYFESQAI